MSEVITTPMEYTHECHGVYSSFLYTTEECAGILSEVRALDSWHMAQVTIENNDGTSQDLEDASTRSARVFDSPVGATIIEGFEARVRRDALPQIESVWGVDLRELLGTQLIYYQPGGHYSAHQDGGGAFANRYFTVVCYLNSDFVGGNTSFPTIPHVTHPRTGKVVIFPSQYYHCAEPVTQGEKYALITWVCGPTPVRWL